MKFSPLLLTLAALVSLLRSGASAAPTHLVSQPPVEVKVVASGVVLVDFGRVAFGNIALKIPADAQGEVTVRFGEAMKDGRVDRKPGATIRYSEVKVQLRGGEVVVAPPADKRNTTKPAILTPPEWGVVTPFGWVEIEGWPGELPAAQITRRAATEAGGIWSRAGRRSLGKRGTTNTNPTRTGAMPGAWCPRTCSHATSSASGRPRKTPSASHRIPARLERHCAVPLLRDNLHAHKERLGAAGGPRAR